jgi:hypothetical protein
MMWSFATIQWSKQNKEDKDLQDKFEDTKGVIRNHKLKKDRQCNGRKKKANNDS